VYGIFGGIIFSYKEMSRMCTETFLNINFDLATKILLNLHRSLRVLFIYNVIIIKIYYKILFFNQCNFLIKYNFLNKK